MNLRKINNISIKEELGEVSLSNFLKITDDNIQNKENIIIKVNPIVQELELRGVFQ